MVRIQVADARDQRLSDYVRLRDTSLRRHLESADGLFIAEGEKVIRRAVAAGYRPRSFLLAERWLAGLEEVLQRWPEVPVYVVTEDLAEEVTGFHVHRGALASLHREERYTRGRPADPAAPGHPGRHRRPHQRRRHPAQCRGAGLGRRAAVAAGRGPAVPAVDQGQHGRGVLLALGPDQRLVRHAGPAERRRIPHRGAEPGARRRRPRSGRGRSPPRPAGGDHGGHRGGRSVTALDRRRDHPGPDPDVRRASTR